MPYSSFSRPVSLSGTCTSCSSSGAGAVHVSATGPRRRDVSAQSAYPMRCAWRLAHHDHVQMVFILGNEIAEINRRRPLEQGTERRKFVNIVLKAKSQLSPFES